MPRPSHQLIRGHTVPPRNPQGRREGVTRGTSADVPRVTLACMIGKLSKIATGKMQMHVVANQVDFAFLSRVAAELGAPASLVEAIAAGNTARHVQELVDAAGFKSFYNRLGELAAQQCHAEVAGKLAIDVVLFDFDGNILTR